MCGGQREGASVVPALLADVSPAMRISRDELFGPAIGVSCAKDIDEAIALASVSLVASLPKTAWNCFLYPSILFSRSTASLIERSISIGLAIGPNA